MDLSANSLFKAFEFVMTSPYATAGLGLLGLWLFILILREFTVWYFKIHQVISKVNAINESVIQIEAELEKLSDRLKSPSVPLVSGSSLAPDTGMGSSAEQKVSFEMKKDVQFPIDR